MNAVTAVAIDIGGTKTSVAAVSFPDLRIAERTDLPTPMRAMTGRDFLDHVCSIARDTAAKAEAQAIGISICELVDNEGGVKSDHRVRWDGSAARQAFTLPVAIDSDVRAGALAEARFGAGKLFRDIFYVNIGTGISSCWVKEGRVHRGARGNALVIANSPVDFTCPSCGEDGSYVLEDIAGGEGLASRYRTMTGSNATARDIVRAADEGEPAVQRIIADAVRALGVSIGLAVNILDPEALVIGGGLGTARGSFSHGLDRSIRDHIWSKETRRLPIVTAKLGKDSALIGAAAIAADMRSG
jgi:glucokinase